MSKDLFYETISGDKKPIKPKKANPLIKVYGDGPEGKKCGACKHHFFRLFANQYPKCELRKVTGGPATDHSSRFNACGKFEPKEEKE